MTFTEANNYLIDKGAVPGKPADNGLVNYRLGEESVAYVSSRANPLRLSVRCDKQLAKHLSEKYESVMPGHKLDSRKWITLVASGQLSDDEIYDLINHALLIAKNS